MKIYISADMEGISGINGRAFVGEGLTEYQRGRALMTADLNAVIEGFFEAGAEQVCVNDSHGSMRNLILEDLDPRAVLISGSLKKGTMMAEMDASFDAVALIGYHAKAGGPGLMAHTMSSKHIACMKLNGLEVGELGLSAAMAGHFGKPVILVSGDDALECETEALLPDCSYVRVKRCLSARTAECAHPAQTAGWLRAGAQEALQKLQKSKVFKLDTPVHAEVSLLIPAMADAAESLPGMQRLSGTTLGFTCKDALEANAYLHAIISLANIE